MALDIKFEFDPDENDLFRLLGDSFSFIGESNYRRLIFFSAHHLRDRGRIYGMKGVWKGNDRRAEAFARRATEHWNKQEVQSQHFRLINACKSMLEEAEATQREFYEDVCAYLAHADFALPGTHFESALSEQYSQSFYQAELIGGAGPQLNEDSAAIFMAECLYSACLEEDEPSRARIARLPSGIPSYFLIPLPALGQFRAAACLITPSQIIDLKYLSLLNESRQWVARLYASSHIDLFLFRLAKALSPSSTSMNEFARSCINHPRELCEALSYLWRSEEVAVIAPEGKAVTIGSRGKDRVLEFSSLEGDVERSRLHKLWRDQGNGQAAVPTFPEILQLGNGDSVDGWSVVHLPFRLIVGDKISNLCNVESVLYLCKHTDNDRSERVLHWSLLERKIDLFVGQMQADIRSTRESVAAGMAHEMKNTSEDARLLAADLHSYVTRSAGHDDTIHSLVERLYHECTLLNASSLAFYSVFRDDLGDVKESDPWICRQVFEATCSLAWFLTRPWKVNLARELMDPGTAAELLNELLELKLSHPSIDQVIGRPLVCLHLLTVVEPIRNVRIQNSVSGNDSISLTLDLIENNHGCEVLLHQRQLERVKPEESSFDSKAQVRLYSLLQKKLMCTFETQLTCKQQDRVYEVEFIQTLRFPYILKCRS